MFFHVHAFCMCVSTLLEDFKFLVSNIPHGHAQLRPTIPKAWSYQYPWLYWVAAWN